MVNWSMSATEMRKEGEATLFALLGTLDSPEYASLRELLANAYHELHTTSLAPMTTLNQLHLKVSKLLVAENLVLPPESQELFKQLQALFSLPLGFRF